LSIITKPISALSGRAKILAFLAALLLLALACTPADAQWIQGILQDVDSANGEITIVTEDVKTITLTITTDASVDTEGTSSSVETLESGVSIEASVADDGEHTTKISARQSKIHGTVKSIGEDDAGNKVISIETRDGTVVVIVDATTRIELEEDSHGSLADIPIGAEIEVKFDPETGVAFKLDLEQEEAEIEGWVDGIIGNFVTIETEHGRILTVEVDDNTRIELADDSLGTLADIVDGLKIEADFDPSSLAAFKIEIEQYEEDEEEDGDEKADDDDEEDDDKEDGRS
jgi:ferric-dicitrate binding protein FerR (iron transport regulator)